MSSPPAIQLNNARRVDASSLFSMKRFCTPSWIFFPFVKRTILLGHLSNQHSGLSSQHFDFFSPITMTTETANASSPSGRRSPIVPTSPPAAKRIKTDIDAVASKTPFSDIPQIPAESNTTAHTTNAKMTSLPPPALQIKKLSEKARLPTRGSAFAAGYDLYAARDTVIPARGKALVDTDISIAVPADTCKFPTASLLLDHKSLTRKILKDGRIAPRSGLAAKHFIDTGAGVIDADYRGPVKVLLFNHADADFEVKEGDRVAQLIIERIYTPEVVEVQELEESVRGAGGFGSTGGFGAGPAPAVAN